MKQEDYQKNMKKIKVGVIGTGNIGTDLVERLLRDTRIEVIA